jgi:hypothetical protein
MEVFAHHRQPYNFARQLDSFAGTVDEPFVVVSISLHASTCIFLSQLTGGFPRLHFSTVD